MRDTRTRVRMFAGTAIAAMVAFAAPWETHTSAFQPPPGSAVAEWQLDEESGTSVADTSGFSNTGNAVDGTQWTSGLVGGSLEFNGTTDYVQVPAASPSSSLRRPSIAYAISAWVHVRGTGPNGGDVATMGDNYTLRIQPDGNVKTFFYSSGSWHTHTTVGVDVIDDGWHHLVGQYDGTNVTVYVDGDQKQSTPFPGLAIQYANGSDFYLGKHGNGGTQHTFNGFIDQVRVYDRSLSPDEIARLAAEAPVAHWKLDESDGQTIATDSSALGVADGTVNDAQAWTTTGAIDGALTFGGTTELTVANPPTTPAARSMMPLRGYAISAWVKADATGTNGGEVATMGDSYALRIQPNGNVKTFFHDGTTWRSHTAAVDVLGDDQWHHLVGQYDGTTLEIYVDTTRYDGPDFPGATMNYAGRGTAFHLGQHGNGSLAYGLTGAVDQVRVYGRALTSAEVTTLFEERVDIPPPTTQTFRVLTWNLRKCRDTTINQTQDCVRTAGDIQALQPDIVLLSAVPSEAGAQDIAATLGWPPAYFRQATGTSEGQAIISRFPMDGVNDQYPPQVFEWDSPFSGENQVAIKATLTVAGQKVHVFAIDQDHQFPAARTDQANHFRDFAWGFQPDGFPMIVAGDFNEDDGPGINEWLIKPGPDPDEAFFDDWTRAESRAADTDLASGRTKRSRLDHILSYRGASDLETGAAKVWIRRLNTDCTTVAVLVCKPENGECTNACNSPYIPEDRGGARSSDHAILTIDFRLPSGS